MLGCGCRLGVRTGAVDRRTPEAGGRIGGRERLIVRRLGALYRRAVGSPQDERRLSIAQTGSRLRRRGKRGGVRGCCRDWREKVRVRGEECIDFGIASELQDCQEKVRSDSADVSSSNFTTSLTKSNLRRGNSSAPARPISCRSCLRSGQRYGYGLPRRHSARGRLRAGEHRERDRRCEGKQVSHFAFRTCRRSKLFYKRF